MLKNFSVSNHTSEELIFVGNQFNRVTQGPVRAGLEVRLTKVGLWTESLTQAINQTQASDFTPLLALADNRRDNAYRALKFCVLSAMYRESEAMRLAAETIESILKRHNTKLYELGYVAQTTEMDSITLDLDKVTDEIATIGMTEIYEEMKEAMTNFSFLYDARQQAQAKNKMPLVSESKKELSRQMIQLLRQVSIFYDDDPEAMKPLIDVYNEIITEVTAKARARQTRNKNNAPDNGNGNVLIFNDTPVT